MPQIMKHLILLGFGFIFHLPGFGQGWDIGVGGGITSYRGDIQSNLFKLKPGWSSIIWSKYNFNSHWGLRASLAQKFVSAADSLNSDLFQRSRNLSFQSEILEAALQVEFYFWPYVPGSLKKRYSPYLALGVSHFWFDPMTRYKGTLVALQPLGTEGQGLADKLPTNPWPLLSDRYALNSWAFPVHFGFRHNLNTNWSIGIEWMYSFTLTDYLDDVSGKYFDPYELRRYRSSMAADLSDRSWEIGLSDKVVGTQRGVNAYNDFYWSCMLLCSYHIPSKKCRMVQ